MKDAYDYIIVGAGSSGCALANQLSADPSRTVLLIESGPSDHTLFISMPRGIGVILDRGSKYVWDYPVTYTGGNRPPERWFKGKVIGGSSSVNGMVYMRGAPLDFDRWAEMGCTGWSWNDVGAKYVQLEDHELGAAKYRGKGGPLHVTVHPKGDPLYEAIIKAGGEMGVARVEDINDVDAVREGGIGYQPRTIYRGKRASSANAFLDPVRKRPNLDIVSETDVLKIEFEGKRAVAVRARDKTGQRSIRANREIIISAGAIQTPKLLQLSGVGPAALLQQHGIEVVADSPEVGRNLREHRHFDIKYRVKSHSQNEKLSGLAAIWSTLRYFVTSKGPMTHSAHEVGGFMKTDPSLPHADLQFGLLAVSANTDAATGKVTLDDFLGITFLGYYTRPKSQGEIRIQSADPDEPPYINANHLDEEIDRERRSRWSNGSAAWASNRRSRIGSSRKSHPAPG